MEKQNELKLVHYTGTKTIQACPMSKLDAEKELGRSLKSAHSKEGEDEPGYLVVYPDGYRSWSPESVFEDAYHCTEDEIDTISYELSIFRGILSRLQTYRDRSREISLEAGMYYGLLQLTGQKAVDLRNMLHQQSNKQATHEEV